VHISLALNKHTPDDNRSYISPAGAKLCKVLAVISPNASETRVYSEHLYYKLSRAFSYFFARVWNPGVSPVSRLPELRRCRGSRHTYINSTLI